MTDWTTGLIGIGCILLGAALAWANAKDPNEP